MYFLSLSDYTKAFDWGKGRLAERRGPSLIRVLQSLRVESPALPCSTRWVEQMSASAQGGPLAGCPLPSCRRKGRRAAAHAASWNVPGSLQGLRGRQTQRQPGAA